MTTASLDDDWITPLPTPSERAPQAKPFAGVYRIEASGEEAVRFASLIQASVEPPTSPESELRGVGGCLAECHPDECRWVLTALGRDRIELEARGADADTILDVMLGSDLRDCA
jgi:hypothetical protein